MGCKYRTNLYLYLSVKKWSKRKLTLIGRITIIKSLALAKFVHLFLALPNPPGELVKKIEKNIL